MPFARRQRPLPIRSLTIVALLCLVATTNAGRQASSPAELIAKVKAHVAPDTRVAVFDVKSQLKDGGLELTGEVDQPAARDAVLAAFKTSGQAVTDKIAVLPDAGVGPRQYGLVTVSVAVHKTKPSHSSELGNQLVMGTAVKLLKKESGWYFAQSLTDRYLGWVEPDHVALLTKEELDSALAARRLVVTSVFALVRERPAEEAEVVSDVVFGNLLRLTGQANGWLAVELPDGRSGYLPAGAGSEYSSWKASRQAAPDAIEKTARLFVGVPYLWGGTSAKGFDCSGFTKTVFRANGVELDRDADQQALQGEAVPMVNDLAALRKGDLLCFGPRAGVSRITHVGIYLGRKRFIHCAGRVRFNSFDPASPIYSESLLGRLVTVRRLTTNP
jgi:gamma-D-glutamyl-L-lysine dipeptidyl-peptidase